MKKLIAVFAVALLSVASMFAFDLSGVKGTWQDAKWDADWTFGADGTIVLTKTSTGEAVYTFSEANVSNFKVNAGAEGVTISFKCAETERAYSFTKPLSLNADLKMTVNPDWSDEDYNTTIKFKK